MDSGLCTPRITQPVRFVVFNVRVRVRKSIARDAASWLVAEDVLAVVDVDGDVSSAAVFSVSVGD